MQKIDDWRRLVDGMKKFLNTFQYRSVLWGMTSRHYDGILDFWKKLQPKSLFECRNPPTVVVAKYNSTLQYTVIRQYCSRHLEKYILQM